MTFVHDSSLPPCPDLAALRDYLRQRVAGLELVDTRVPLVPELRLWVLNADYPTGRLPLDAMNALLDDPPYWAFCWGSGAVLSRWLFDHPAAVRGKTVLDVGSGGGVVAVAAARAGAARVVACDVDPRARIAVHANARRNAVDVAVCDDYFAVAGDVDVLLSADILYDRDNLPLLDHFRERATSVLVADSRVAAFSVPGYSRVSSGYCRVTPDLGEAEPVNRVTVYGAGTAALGG